MAAWGHSLPLRFPLRETGKGGKNPDLVSGDYSPEKAGVGGSIPSLATMFSTIYKASLRRFHSISFQNWRGRFASSGMLECGGWLSSRFALYAGGVYSKAS